MFLIGHSEQWLRKKGCNEKIPHPGLFIPKKPIDQSPYFISVSPTPRQGSIFTMRIFFAKLYATSPHVENVNY